MKPADEKISSAHLIEKKTLQLKRNLFVVLHLDEKLLYTSEQNRQIRMVDSIRNTLGFEKKLLESISYLDS